MNESNHINVQVKDENMNEDNLNTKGLKKLNKKIKTLKRYVKLFFFLYTFSYIFVLFSQVDISNSNDGIRSLKKFILNKETNVNTFYVDQLTIYNIFKTFVEKLVLDVPFEINNRFFVLSNVRLTQRRVQEIENTNPLIWTLNESYVWATEEIDPSSEFDPQVESNESFSNGGKTFEFDKKTSFMKKGGFVIYFNASTFMNNEIAIPSQEEYNKTKLKEISDIYISDFISYIDSKSAVITIDFIMANYDLEYLCPVILTFQLTNVGQAIFTFKMMFLDKNVYTSTMKLVRAFFEILLLLMFIAYLFCLFWLIKIQNDIEYFKIANEIEKKKSKLKSSLTLKKKKLFRVEEKSQTFDEKNDKTERSHIRLIKNHLKLDNTNNPTEKASNEKIPSKHNLVYPNKFFLYLQTFLNDSINLLHLLSMIFTIICIVQWFIYISSLILNKYLIENLFLIDTGVIPFDLHNDLIDSSIAYDKYINYGAVNFLFIFILFATFVVESFNDFKFFLLTLVYAGEDLISFFLLFLVFFLATSFFSFLYYTKFYPDFSDILTTIQFNMTFALGWIDSNISEKLYSISPIVTIVYLMIVVFFIKYVLLKMLLSILMFYFKVAFEEYNSSNREIKLLFMSEKQLKKVKHRHWFWIIVFKYLEFTKIIWNFICCKRSVAEKEKSSHKESKSSNKTKNENEMKESKSNYSNTNKNNNDLVAKMILSNINFQRKRSSGRYTTADNLRNSSVKFALPKDFVDYNTSFSENYMINKRQKYFESVKDEEKLTEYYETKYRNSYVYFLLYYSLILIFSFISLFNALSPWLNLSKSATYDQLTSYPKFPNSHKFFNINSTPTLRDYIFGDLNFIQLFTIKNGGVYFLDINSVLYDRLVVTVRKSTANPKYVFTDYVRQNQVINLEGPLEFENTTSFAVGDIEMKFSVKNSYHSLGGYPWVIDLSKMLTSEYINTDFVTEYIDDYTVIVYLELFLDNLEYGIISYILLTCSLDYGGNYNTQYIGDLINVNVITSNYDYIKLVCEFIFCVLTLYFFVIFIKDIYLEIKAYKKWRKDIVDSFSDKTREYREKVMPEVYRMIFSLLTLDRIAEVILIYCTVSLIYSRINLLIFQFKNITQNGYDYLKTNNIQYLEFRAMIYEQMNNRLTYLYYLSIILPIMSVRIIKVLSFGKYFSILIETIATANKNNIIFMFIIIIIQPAFISYSYLAFGKNIQSFSTWSNSLFTCVNILFGEFDFTNYYESNPVLGPIFFFIYMILFNMVLLNLFSATIDSSYIKIKEKVKNLNEKYELKRVYCFCFFKRRNLLNEIFLPIEGQFDDSQRLSLSNYSFRKSMLSTKVFTPKEWAEHEVISLKTIDEALLSARTRCKKVSLAYYAKDIGTHNYLFDESLFKGVEEKHIKVTSVLENLMMIDVVDKLQSEILLVENYKNHLEEYTSSQILGDDVNELQKINDRNYDKVAQLEKLFMNAYEDFKELKAISETLDNLDNDLTEEFDIMEREASNLFSDQVRQKEEMEIFLQTE